MSGPEEGKKPAPSRIYPLRPHPKGQAYQASTARFNVVPAGRRSGKTERAKRRLMRRALLEREYPDANFFASAPTYMQAKQIFWNDLKAMTPPEMLRAKPSESELFIPLRNGATIFVFGMDKPERMEGRPWNGGILDEFANMKAKAWGENVRPALSDRKGWCDLTGVPEGRNHYYDLWKDAISGADPEWAGFTWHSSEVLDPKEVASAKRQLDPLVFQQEYEASFVNFEGRIYYPFNEATHCADLKYYWKRTIGFCFDFNVDPGVCVIVQEQRLPGQYERDPATGLQLLNRPVTGTGVIGEVWIPQNSNTPAVCRKLIQEYGEHQGFIEVFGDATGGARKTSQTEGSDWDIIRRDLREHFGDRISFDIPLANPTERARVNAMNSRLMTGDGTIRLMVDRQAAPHVIKDLEGVRALQGGSGEIDKKHDRSLTHVSDALGYYVQRRFPVVERIAQFDPSIRIG